MTATAVADQADPTPPGCLIVSRRDSFTRELVRTLQLSGYRPIVRDSAEAAAKGLADSSVDAVVIDTSLPGVSLQRIQGALAPDGGGPPESLEVVEARHIARMLEHTGGNRRGAAQLLGIARSTLLAKIRKYGLDREPMTRSA
jgi:DNA-binding NtrC family response regulator